MRKILIRTVFAAYWITVLSCNKDKDFDNYKYGVNDPGSSPIGVGFPQGQNKVNTTSINNVSTSQEFSIALVNLLSDEAATQDVHVTLEADPTLITAYNTNNNPDLIPLPTAAYTISTLVVTIPKGQRTGTLKLVIPSASTTLDITKGYALGFKIKSIQEPDVRIAQNFSSILVGIAIKNQFDGVYSLKGYSLRAGDAAKTGNFSGAEIGLITAGVASNTFSKLQIWADGTGVSIGEPTLTVDAVTNKVTVTSSGGAANLPGYDSRYDPATKTYFVGFTWGGGPTQRVAIDTLTYVRPR